MASLCSSGDRLLGSAGAGSYSAGPWMLGVASRAPGGSFCRCRVNASFVSYTKASWTHLSRFGSRALVDGVMVVTGRIESKPDSTCARGDGRWQRDSLI